MKRRGSKLLSLTIFIVVTVTIAPRLVIGADRAGEESVKCPSAGAGNRAQEPGQEQEKERKAIFEHAIPDELKLIEIKNLRDPDWPEKFELWFRNVSNKSIYFIRTYLILAEIPHDPPVIFILEYGAARLWDPNNLPSDDDKPINPGEIIIMRVPEIQRRKIRRFLTDRSLTWDVDRINISVNIINFGDQKGYFGGAKVKPKGNDE